MIKKLFVFIIKVYQRTFSPDQGIFRYLGFRVCRFSPTCSQYALEAIEKYGLAKGFLEGAKRILRCHPFHDGGYDPVR